MSLSAEGCGREQRFATEICEDQKHITHRHGSELKKPYPSNAGPMRYEIANIQRGRRKTAVLSRSHEKLITDYKS
jgi:hypothetical protein